MRNRQFRCLVFTAAMASAFAVIPASARAQSCGNRDSLVKQLLDEKNEFIARTLAAGLQGLGTQAEKDAQAAADKLAKEVEADEKLEDECPKVQPKAGIIHTPSLTGVSTNVDLDKDFMDFYGKGPLKSRSFAPGFAQPKGAAGAGAGESALTSIRLSVVGEVGVAHGGGATLLSFQGGIRIKMGLRAIPKLVPFTQVLLGLEHCGACQYNAFSIQPGFGVVYCLKRRLGLVGQLDFRLVPSSENELLISGGGSIPFGK